MKIENEYKNLETKQMGPSLGFLWSYVYFYFLMFFFNEHKNILGGI